MFISKYWNQRSYYLIVPFSKVPPVCVFLIIKTLQYSFVWKAVRGKNPWLKQRLGGRHTESGSSVASNCPNVRASTPQFPFFFLFYFILLFLDRGEGREKERERNIKVRLPLARPLLGTWPATQACAPTGNRTGSPLVCRLVLNALNHTSQGPKVPFLLSLLNYFLKN